VGRIIAITNRISAFFSHHLTSFVIGPAGADAYAWPEAGKERLEVAIKDDTDFAVETTLGGWTIMRLLLETGARADGGPYLVCRGSTVWSCTSNTRGRPSDQGWA